MNPDLDTLSDDQWEEIADYVSDQATPTAAAAMRQRLTTDATLTVAVTPLLAFRELFAPTRAAVRAARPSAQVTEQTAAHTVVAWARLEAALATQPPAPAAVPGVSRTIYQSQPFAPRATASATRSLRTGTPWWQRSWAVAAGIACLLLVGAGVVFRVTYPVFRYTGGTTGRVVTLPDATTATLAPGAYLGTSHTFTHGLRDVYLFGQADFHVAPDPNHPFIVHVVGVDATALGTTFTMASDTLAHVTVDVTQGKVSLMMVGIDGVRRPVAVLTAGHVQQITALTQWMTEAGAVLGSAGVPFSTVVQVHNALLRAAATLATPHP